MIKKTIYSFLGLPGSGKGTQAQIMIKKIGIRRFVGVGDLVRDLIKDGDLEDPVIAAIKKRYDAGIPQPDSVAKDLIRGYIEKSTADIVLDNFPFSPDQANFLASFVEENKNWSGPKVIYINISAETAIKRATTRKICSECGTIFGAVDEMICEKCGGSLIVRTDDNEDTIRTRLSFYLPRIKEVIKKCKEDGISVYEIDGERAIEEIAKDVEKIYG